jgi:stage III sporulation protein AH
MRFKRDLKSVNMKSVSMKNVNMKKLFRRNQIIVTTLAVMIAAAGYLNYTGKQDLEAGNVMSEAGLMDISEEDIMMENQRILDAQGGYEEIQSLDQDLSQIEEAESVAEGDLSQLQGDPQQLAQAETIGDQAGMEAGALDSAQGNAGDTQTGYENPGEAILTSGMSVSDYIAGVQLNREQVRAKNKDTLLAIINNANIEESAKQEAIQDMIRLTEISEKENAAETLLMAKGFSDPVVSISSEKVDVVVNASSITDAQRAQIEDIVKRKAEVQAENIIITLLNLAD